MAQLAGQNSSRYSVRALPRERRGRPARWRVTPEGVESDVRLAPAGIGDKSVVHRLLEFNAYEFSRFNGADVDRHPSFGYRHLDHYWTEPDRHPYLIEVGTQLAGVVLVRSGTPHSMAEFLVLPKYRRSGVGGAAARAA